MKTNYFYEVPCTYIYEVEANSEEEARKLLIIDGGTKIKGVASVFQDAYLNAKFIGQEEIAIVYPFERGDTYYTIEQTGAGYEACESVWDDVSEALYNMDPESVYFKSKGNAWKGVRLINSIEKFDKYYDRSEDFIAYERGRQQHNAIRLLADELNEAGSNIINKYLVY